MTIWSSIFIVSLVIALSVSCKKIPFDYRNHYTGTWEMQIHRTNKPVVNYLGRIYYKGPGTEVFIEYGKDAFFVVKLGEGGQLGTQASGYVKKSELYYNAGSFYIKGWR